MQLTVSHSGVIENRVQPDAPGASWPDARDWFVQWQEHVRAERGDVVVNTQTALTYSVVWRCVNYIAGTIASLCWHVYQEDENEKTRLPVHDNVAWTLEMQANPETSALDWRQAMLRDALLWGNGVAEIERNGAGKPLWLWRIDPSRVSLERGSSGRLRYRVTNQGGGGGDDSFLDPADVFHLKGLSPDGLVGYSPIAVARRAIELGLQQEAYGVGFFRRGPTPGGFLKAPGNMPEAERRALSKSFGERHGGVRNAGSVPVLSGGMDFVPFVMPNKDAEWVLARGLQAEEICRIYGVPQHVAGVLTHATNNNIEHQGIEAVQYCLYPWCRRLEVEADVKLYGRVQIGRRRTRLDLSALLRGDSQAQTASLTSQITNGLRTVNEGRAALDLNPIEGGDTPLVQGAMIPLTAALAGAGAPKSGTPGAAPATPAAPAEPPELLDVPQLLQSRAYDCGACCTQIVAEFFGVGGGRTEGDYIEELGTTTADGTQPEAIIDLLNDVGLVTTSGPGMSVDDLGCAFRAGKPVIVLLQSLDASATGQRAGHWVVVIGCGFGVVIFQDPVEGRTLLAADDFDARWHNQPDDDEDAPAADHYGIIVADGFGGEEETETETETGDEPAAPARNDQSLTAAFTPLLADVYARQLKVEAEKATRAQAQGHLAAWTAEFYGNGLADRVAASLRPVLGALALAAGLDADPEELAGKLAVDHARQSRADLSGGVPNWEGRPAEQAKRHLAMALEELRP